MRDMIEETAVLRAITEGRSREELANDILLERAVTRTIEIIGEAASQISDDSRDKVNIQWSLIVGMRNRLIHGYRDISMDILWSVAREAAPEMAERLQAYLDETS